MQGVFFRVTCRREALSAGVGGYVRNLRDGRVEAVFEGDPAAVQRMIEWCHRGSGPARVDAVEVSDEQPVGEEAFEVG